MIEYIDCNIKQVYTHWVGNNIDGDLSFSKGAIDISDPKLRETLLKYYINSFKSDELYEFYHDTDIKYNVVYDLITSAFTNPGQCLDISIDIAKYLFEKSSHPNIKYGEFCLTYFSNIKVNGQLANAIGLFKSENKDTFLKISKQEGNVSIEAESGININKIDKGCIIFNIDQENGYIVCVIDNTNRGIDARYWIDDFLHVRQRKDEYYNTHNVMAMCKNYVTKHLPNEFMVTKADQAEILNETIKYFKEQDNFSFDEFSQKVISDPKVVESFNRFKDEYEQERDIQIEDEFAISDSAVKKQSRAFKSVIKLDKNFHIYVHGNNQYIKKGYDKTTGMYYYQLFFKEEL